MLSRRNFLALSATLPWALRGMASASPLKLPVGLELYSVRESLKRDPDGTLRAVAKMGYECVEFYAPYFDWSEAQAKQTRKLLDELGMKCYSTHNAATNLNPENIQKAKDFNRILGSKYLVLASSDPKTTLDGWKAVADILNASIATDDDVLWRDPQVECGGSPAVVEYDGHRDAELAAVLADLLDRVVESGVDRDHG